MSNEPNEPNERPQPREPRETREVQLTARQVIDLFNRLYYDVGNAGRATWQRTWWMGVQLRKYPTDLMIYQELIVSTRPKLIVETGACTGGSALFFCHMLDLLGGDGGDGAEGTVVSIDVDLRRIRTAHRRLTLLQGSSTDPVIVEQVRARAAALPPGSPVMVILDSDHSRDHVLAEMRAYHALVTPGSYLIVEDTNVNGHPVLPEHGPGPNEAVRDFMAENADFQIEPRCEKFLLTANPGGFLRRRGGIAERGRENES